MMFEWATKQLKPCPFCGEKPAFLIGEMPKNVVLDKKRPLKYYAIRCSSCNVTMKVFTRYQLQAIITWNHRHEKV